MSWWAPRNDQITQALASREDMISEDELVALPGAFYGASANTVKKAFPTLIPGSLTDKPWEKGAERTVGIGVNNTWWVLDPTSLRRGVWVLNSTSEEAARNAANAMSPTQWGYFYRTSSEIPPIAELQAANLTFGKGFTEAYYRYYPEQDPRPKKKAPSGPTAPPVAVKTYEMVGTLNGQVIPLTEIVRHVGGSDYELAEGADLAVADGPEDGFGLAGDPGKWGEYYGGASPSQYGLDRDKAVMFWDGARGKVLPASVLRDWFGANWRAAVY